MNIVEVIPISRGISKETLSYFTSANIEAGALVQIPIRGKIKSGLVISANSVESAKSQIKTADFAFRRVQNFKSKNFFLPEFIETAKESADFFASTTGAILHSIIPKLILENAEESEIKKPDFPIKKNTIQEKFIIQTEDEKRFDQYKNVIQKEFTKKSSVFFCAPTIESIEPTFQILSKGIETRVFVLHNKLGKKKFKKTIEDTEKETRPVLIIGTAQFLCLPIHNLGTIIIEKESSHFYKAERRPHLDFRKFAEILAEKMKIGIIFGDSILRTETVWQFKEKKFLELSPVKFEFSSSAKTEMIDMKGPLEINGVKQKFKILSDKLIDLVKKNILNGQNMFIFGARRGLATQTVCGDCGTVVLCNKCQSPITLHKKSDLSDKNNQNFFLCHRCGEKQNANVKCKNCDSWKLRPLGIGIELIEQELHQTIPKIKIFRADKDSALTVKTAKETISKFYSSAGSILLGTESVLPFLTKKIENCAIASIDSMFSLPDFRIGEKVINIVLQIRSLAAKEFVIQTRNPEQKSLKYGLTGKMLDFYEEEIAERKKFNYPPFSIFIKLSLSGKKDSIWQEMNKAAKSFEGYDFSIFPAFVEMAKGKYNLNAVIKLKNDKWIDYDLLSKLRSLPQSFNVEVEPKSLL